MASNYYHWKCKWCGQGEGCLDYDPNYDRFKCLLCLRLERTESVLVRNVKVEVVNPQYAKDVVVLDTSFLRLVRLVFA